jgi:endonuclease/exonuclease/phosphatase family metal-dependent hydrolase
MAQEETIATSAAVSRDAALLAECRTLVAELRRFPTLVSLHDSPDGPGIVRRLHAVLGTVRRFGAAIPVAPAPPEPVPAPADAAMFDEPERVRAVHWNIEHGNAYPLIEKALVDHPQLHGMDLVFLNEVDLGMARSGNRDVAAGLAEALGLHGAWAPLFLETTPGRDDDPARAAGGENQESLFGIALLSRWPIGDIRLVALPGPAGLQFDRERMYGRHVALIAVIERPGSPFVAVAVHLEVHRTREHRTTQMRALLEELRRESRPVILAGDFNTHTFDRGGWWSPLAGAVTLLQPLAPLRKRLLWPDQGPARETLFDALREADFAWQRYVDRSPSLNVRLARVTEAGGVLGLGLAPLLRWMEGRAQLKLDWFAGRGWREGRGATVRGFDGPGLASDHAPIIASFW